MAPSPNDAAPAPDAPSYLIRPDGARIAYCKTPGRGPGVVFLGGYASDMTGTKALALERFARARGRAFLRLDYRGHGQSSGDFADGTIGLWLSDAIAAIEAAADGPQILVGSSMGGWLMLLVAKRRPELVAGLVGIAAAPDFAEDIERMGFAPEELAVLRRDGVLRRPSPYGPEPTVYTMAMVEEARSHLVLREPLPLRVPLRLLHGMADPDVPWRAATRIAEHAGGGDVRVHLLKDGDHRLSTPRDLAILEETVGALLDGDRG